MHHSGRAAEYHGACQRIDGAERACRGGRAEAAGELRALYEKTLAAMPALEGFWVRWAHSEFSLCGDITRSLLVFDRAVEVLPRSLRLWVAYLKFAKVVVGGGLCAKLLKDAVELVGDQFWAHEVWNLKLEQCSLKEEVQLLLNILSNKTLHQVSHYYHRLLTLLESESGVLAISEALNVTTEGLAEEDVPKLKELLLSKLKLHYDLHVQRVETSMLFERRLKRQFYYPEFKAKTAQLWIEYAEASPQPLAVLARATIFLYDDKKLWVQYLRTALRSGLDSALRRGWPKYQEVTKRLELAQQAQQMEPSPARCHVRSIETIVLERLNTYN